MDANRDAGSATEEFKLEAVRPRSSQGWQPAWSRHPNGLFVVSVLRMMALNILAIARKLSRLKGCNEAPGWHRVTEHLLLVLCATTLLTAELDVPTE